MLHSGLHSTSTCMHKRAGALTDTAFCVCVGVLKVELMFSYLSCNHFIDSHCSLWFLDLCLCEGWPCSVCLVHVWRSEDNFAKLVLSFYLYVGSGDRTQVVKLASKCIYLLSHLTHPNKNFLKIHLLFLCI